MVIILVVGATGQQGGGVIRALLNLGRTDLTIRALTRSPSSPAAKRLEGKGVQIFKGDLLDRESLSKALQDIEVAYLVTDFRGDENIDGELKQGKQFIDSAKENGVKHLVFSSVAGADIARPVEHFYTKYQLEEYIKASVVPPPGIGRFFFLSAMASLMGNTKQKYVACEDIGKAVAKALLDPESFGGKIVTVAGQVADVDELQAALENGEGQKGWPRIWLPRWFIIKITPHHYKQMFDWLFYDNCQPGDPEETKQLIPDLLSIEEWAKRQQAERAISK